MKKINGRVFGGLCAVSLAACCVLVADAQEQTTSIENPIQQTKQIVHTVNVAPDVVELLKGKIRYTKHWDEDVSDNTLQISQADAVRLMKIAQAEAGNQGQEGMLKVMQVVINRVNSPDYPNSIEAVIKQDHQFQPVTNGTYYTAEPSVEAHLALAELESNLNPDTEIIAFETASNDKSLERYFAYAYTHGGHNFYTVKEMRHE